MGTAPEKPSYNDLPRNGLQFITGLAHNSGLLPILLTTTRVGLHFYRDLPPIFDVDQHHKGLFLWNLHLVCDYWLAGYVRRRTDLSKTMNYGLDTRQSWRVDFGRLIFLGEIMSLNKDQIKGRSDEAQGKVKEVVGKVVGNKDLGVKGNIQKNVGAVQASVGDAKEDIAKTVKTP